MARRGIEASLSLVWNERCECHDGVAVNPLCVLTASPSAAGESVFGPTFEDETFQIPFDKRGVLGMANDGLHSNSSQVSGCIMKRNSAGSRRLWTPQPPASCLLAFAFMCLLILRRLIHASNNLSLPIQFFITYRKLEWMESKCVAFG